MPLIPSEFAPFFHYATPPVVGAFIGYITNKVAIKMLFRPLVAWRVFGIKVPMTPGVIPSKRHELAENMGEMVGDHLLTSKEIGHALTEHDFQQHLYSLIEERVGNFLHRDTGPISSVIPQKFNIYYDIAIKTVKFQIKENIHNFIQDPEFAHKIEESLEKRLDHLLKREVGSIFTGHERENIYRFMETNVARLLSGTAMQQWLEDFIQQKVYEALRQDHSLADILPQPLLELLLQTIEKETPNLLLRLATMLKEPEIRQKIVHGARGGVEHFISSLGPMAAIASGFLKMETVEQKIHDYLVEKEEDITKWLQTDEIRERVADALTERCRKFLAKPLHTLIHIENETKIEEFCKQLADRLVILLQGRDVSKALSSMLKANLETYIDSGNLSLEKVLAEFIGHKGIAAGKSWIKSEGIAVLRTRETLGTLDIMIESMITALLNKPIGKLSNLLPADVREEIYRSIQTMASDMLAIEVPGLVDSLNIKRIVAEKVNSLDLMRLERLLLGIMEEQFKYINLFGGILGFLIGCLNLLFAH
ncbi:MAG: DUF445 family protein [Desulfoprunum sp.]|nr:DUF445 family protein [Desulfoprunum sp.]